MKTSEASERRGMAAQIIRELAEDHEENQLKILGILIKAALTRLAMEKDDMPATQYSDNKSSRA